MINNKITTRPIIMYIAIAILCIVTNITAFLFQFFYYELPCPLCLLQRFGFLAIGLGATLSLTDKPSWKYDLIILVSSFYTLVVAFRQVLLHILPHDPGYGSTFFGLHFYTWSAIISFILIFFISMSSVVIFAFKQLHLSHIKFNYHIILIKKLFILIILVNIVFTYFECGFGMCPANPVTYLYSPKNL